MATGKQLGDGQRQRMISALMRDIDQSLLLSAVATTTVLFSAS